MKNIFSMRRAVVAGAILLGLNVFSGVAFAQTTFPMVCRGSTNTSLMNMTLNADANIITGGSTTDDGVVINFTKGTFGAAFAAPFEGTCTWLDRGLVASEPAQLAHVPGVRLNVGFSAGGDWGIGFKTHTIIPYFPVLGPAGGAISGTLYDPNTFYTFNVFNSGKGQFIIKSIRCLGVCS
ncbi:MAG TPA: hypothetical protein VFW00_07435 [Rhodocyclaceae bacterium]|nr:hypothetical protein [Rhodocyclaceae bacterium]